MHPLKSWRAFKVKVDVPRLVKLSEDSAVGGAVVEARHVALDG